MKSRQKQERSNCCCKNSAARAELRSELLAASRPPVPERRATRKVRRFCFCSPLMLNSPDCSGAVALRCACAASPRSTPARTLLPAPTHTNRLHSQLRKNPAARNFSKCQKKQSPRFFLSFWNQFFPTFSNRSGTLGEPPAFQEIGKNSKFNVILSWKIKNYIVFSTMLSTSCSLGKIQI